MKYYLIFASVIQIMVTGVFIAKWQMQYYFNVQGLPRFAIHLEIMIAGLFFFGGLAGLFYILRVKRESESDY